MLQQRITLGLQASLLLLTLSIVHMGGSVLSNLGIMSDIFVVVGFVQTVRFFLNSYIREDVAEAFEDFMNLESVGEGLTELVNELREPGKISKSLPLVNFEEDLEEDLEEEL